MTRLTESDIEDAALEWLSELGFTALHGPEIAADVRGAERTDPSYRDVLLEQRLRESLVRLNPELSPEALDDARRKLLRNDLPSLIERNRALHKLLIDGVPVEFRRPDGSIGGGQARVIDFEIPGNNDWLAVNQFTVAEGQHVRRPDVLLFVNGLPLAVIELKNAADENATISGAIQQLQTYQAQIPALFATNAVLVVSDGNEARIGAIGASKEWFKPWRTVTAGDEAKRSVTELQVLLEGVFEQHRFLQLLRHFIVFEDEGGGTITKKLAGYHQFHAVNTAVEETLRAALDVVTREEAAPHGALYDVNPSGARGDRRVGVVWHTQGSGKSLTMAFYAGRVILHPQMRNPTLVVLTDRNDLDDQLFGTFARCRDLLRQPPVQAADRADLRTKLSVASGGVVFTTIQKFFPEEKGDRHPVLSDRSNIVVIADEAHRSQYDFIDGFARHMRDALPNASFIGFTGTPIEKTDANTRAVFGDYISVYDIQRAVTDGATVPIYYESRLAKLELKASERPNIDPEFEEATEGEEVDRKEKLKSKWAQLEAIVGSDKRLKLVAKDIVEHFERATRSHRRQGYDRLHEPAHLRGALRGDRAASTALAPRPRRRWADEGHHDRLRIGSARLAAPHPQQIAPRGSCATLPRPTGPVQARDRARHVAYGLRRAEPAHDVHRQADARPRPDAGHRAREPRVPRQAGRPRRRLLGIGARAQERARDVHGERRHWQDRARPGRSRGGDAREVRGVLRDAARLRLEKWVSGTAPERLSLLPAAQEHVLALDNGKDRFVGAVRDLSKGFALAVPHAEAMRIRDDVGFFQAVQAVLVKRAASDQRPEEELEHAVRQIISRAVMPEGVIDIFAAAGLKKPDISVLSEEFLADVRGMPQRNLAVELLRKLLSGEIRQRRA